MKIGIDISQIAYKGTGVANYTSELVRNILKVDVNNQYILFGLSFRKNSILNDFTKKISSQFNNVKIKIFPIPISFANKIWNNYHIFNIERLIGEIDIFHSSDWIQPPSKSKKVTTIHDLVIYKFPELSHPYIVQTQKKRLNWVIRECDAVITDSVSSKDDLINILKFKSEKVDVIYPGISNQFMIATKEEKDNLKKKYSLNHDYMLAVGTIEPRKNLKTVISAFEKYRKHSLIEGGKKKIDLVIVGNKGWDKSLEYAENVRFLGFVPDCDLRPLYSAATIFLYPSFYEGFGLPIIEAMACGCPVITSDKGSLAEVAKDAAILIDPMSPDDISHKMIKLTVDKNLRIEMIRKGLLNADRFTWENTAKKVIGIYEKINNR
jgi:glycosyltransferase involved in cell wall biosynthesis